MIFNFFKKAFNFIIIFVGFSAILWMFWVRFLRERLPRDIPFILNDLKFLFLIYICLIYFFILYSLIYPKNFKSFFEHIKEILFKPLKMFDHFLKKNKYTRNSFKKLEKLVVNFIFFEIYPKYLNYIYFTFYIIPRVILVSFFILDILYFHKLFYTYKILWLGIFPILLKYFKYSINVLKKEYFIILDLQYAEIIVETELNGYFFDKYLTIQELLEKTHTVNFSMDLHGMVLCKEEIYAKYKEKKKKNELSKNDYKILKIPFKNLFPKIIALDKFLNYYQNMENAAHFFNIISFKSIKIIIFFLYFFGWCFILWSSFHTLSFESYTIKIFFWVFQNFKDNIEPFSDSIL